MCLLKICHQVNIGFVCFTRQKQIQNGDYNFTYYSQMGKWNLREGLKS